jgi:RNA-directed DNA polymerase
MQAVQERICDQPVLKLLRAMLRAGVMEDGQLRRPVTGTPQGGVISPVMCNVYLHRVDRAWDDEDGVLVRYADDAVVMCWSRSQAEQALYRLTALLADLGLEPKAAKTRIVHLEEGGGGFDFLGFHHRLVRSRGLNGKRPVTFLARWPADKAMQHARDRIRELTRRSRLLLAPEWIVDDLNRFLGGWAAYFRFGNSAARFEKIRSYSRMRLALFISKRHRRSRASGWSVITYQSPDQLGLITLSGIVAEPRPFRAWREDRMPAVNGVGEPCAGEPHARFEVAGAGNGADLTKGTGVAQPTGKPAAMKAPGPTVSEPPRQPPTLRLADVLAC